MNDQFCTKYQQHSQKHLRFCITCANRGNELVSNLFFCAMCSKTKYKQHKDHKQFIDTNTLKDKLKKFQRYINQCQDLNASTNQFVKIVQNKLIQKQLTNQGFRKWLVASQFWKFSDSKYSNGAQENLMKSIYGSFRSSDKNIEPAQEALIDWGKFTNEDGSSIFETMMKEAEKQKQDLDKKKVIIQLIIEAYSCTDENSKKECIEKIKAAQQKYEKQCLLFLAHLYLIQMHNDNEKQWKPILQQLISTDPKIKDSPLICFFESHKYWKKLNNQSAQNCQIKFVSSSTGNIFQLIKPQQYINLLSTGIVHKNKPHFILQAARGLGYLAQSKFNEALRDFNHVISCFPAQQSSRNNIFYAKLKLNSAEQTIFKQFASQIEKKSKHYIINVINYLKKQNLPQQVIKCCKILQQQDNQNTFANIQLVKAYLKTNQIEKAQQIKQNVLKNKINDTLKQRLNRKKIYSQARISANQRDYENTIKHCQSLVDKKESASAYYSLASNLYNQQKWEDAQENINKALKIKQSQKYKKLKFYILLMKKELDQAKKLLQSIDQNMIDPKIKQMLANLN